MGVKMTRGVYTRKPLWEFADNQAMQDAYRLINLDPWTILNTPEYSAEYAKYFGADELAVLKLKKEGKYDMVMSTKKEYVQGNAIWLPPVSPVPPVTPGPPSEVTVGNIGKSQYLMMMDDLIVRVLKREGVIK